MPQQSIFHIHVTPFLFSLTFLIPKKLLKTMTPSLRIYISIFFFGFYETPEYHSHQL